MSVDIEVMTGGGFIGADMVAIDRRARPSSDSTEIDAFFLDRRSSRPTVALFLVRFHRFFPPDVTVINPKPT